MMFGCSPPLTMIPWTRASGRSCWRSWSSATKSWMTAFSALTPRQGVVLGHDRDRGPGPGALDRRAERRGDPTDGPLDLHVVRLEELGEPRVGLLLLEGELGIVVDPVREGLELVGEAVHGRRNP